MSEGDSSSTTLFVGREAELERIRRALDQVRLAVVYGIGGAGKTALAMRAAHELAGRHGAAFAYVSCRPGESATTFAAAVLPQLGMQVHGARSPLETLLQLGASQPLVLCIDDLQRQIDGSLIDAIVHMALHHRSTWLLCVSRELLPISPVDVDHVVTVLDVLDPGDARLLWRRLEELYDRRLGVDAIDELPRTPLQIKRLFAVANDTSRRPDGEGMGIQELPADEASVLAQLCTYRRDVPLAALEGSGGTDSSEGVVERLRARFLVERRGAGRFGVHDVIRHAITHTSFAPGRAEHLRCLAYFCSLPERESQHLEALYHAVQSGEDQTATAMLRDAAARMLLSFPPDDTVADRELANAIEALMHRCPLPDDVRVLRATIRARQGDTETAHRELVSLVAVVPSAQTRLAYGVLEISRGRVADAIAALVPLMEDTTAPALARVAAATSLIGAHLGRDLAAARDALARARPMLKALGTLGDAVEAWVEGILCYESECYDEAATWFERMHRAREAAGGIRLPLAASLEALVAAHRGEAITGEPLGDLLGEGPFLRQVSRLLHARTQLLRGDARGAEAIATEIEQDRAHAFEWLRFGAAQVGCEAELMAGRVDDARRRAESALAALDAAPDQSRPVYLSLQVTLARILVAKGDHRGAIALARDVLPRAHELAATRARLLSILARETPPTRTARPPGLGAFGAAEWELSRAEDALIDGALTDADQIARGVESAAGRAGWCHLRCRAQLVSAEAALRLGRFDVADALAAAARQDAESLAYRAELHTCEVIAAAIGRARGREVALRDDPSALRIGLDSAPTFHLHDNRGARTRLSPHQVDELDLSEYAFVADLARRRVRRDKRWIDLSRREVALALLTALARSPSHWVSIGVLAEQVWHVEYHPLRHHSRVATAMMRLRRSIGTKLVEASSEGYRLVPPAPWLVIVSS